MHMTVSFWPEFRRAVAASTFLLVASLATPAPAADVDALFRAWLAKDLWPEANASGISKATFDAAFAGV